MSYVIQGNDRLCQFLTKKDKKIFLAMSVLVQNGRIQALGSQLGCVHYKSCNLLQLSLDVGTFMHHHDQPNHFYQISLLSPLRMRESNNQPFSEKEDVPKAQKHLKKSLLWLLLLSQPIHLSVQLSRSHQGFLCPRYSIDIKFYVIYGHSLYL